MAILIAPRLAMTTNHEDGAGYLVAGTPKRQRVCAAATSAACMPHLSCCWQDTIILFVQRRQ